MGLTKKFAAAGLFAGCILSTGVSLTGCLSDDTKDPAKPATSTWSADSIVHVGAQGNATLGSAIDLDAKKVMLSAAANAAQSTIDLVFFFSDGDLYLGSPVYAKTLPEVPLAANYDLTKIKDTQMTKASTKPDSLSLTISNFATSPQTNNAVVSGGGSFLVKTGEGRYAYISVDNIQGAGNTASADITLSLIGP
ncbi:MAG: hypothetical protein JF616_12520 [Fibrobacteres bacterium]|nr:hypothetical protein [Fibrobacterota bacterium]